MYLNKKKIYAFISLKPLRIVLSFVNEILLATAWSPKKEGKNIKNKKKKNKIIVCQRP